MAIAIFFLLHWYLSGFCQSFFLHRYGSHKMFVMPVFWERFFHLLTFVTQGASYLNPRAYAIMHRMHHAHSDTDKDPHSPVYFRTPWKMMWNTFKVYQGLAQREFQPETKFEGYYPSWPALDRWAEKASTRILWIVFYTLFYVRFAVSPWQFLLLPVQYLMGPLHGAIVNWCGHRYGYQNFDNRDASRNTLPVDFLTMGELMQNNHHHFGHRPNFAVRKFELDPVYPVLRLFSILKIIRFA